MAAVVLECVKREKLGSCASKASRREGLIPCVVYGDSQEPEQISVARDLLSKYVYKSNFFFA